MPLSNTIFSLTANVDSSSSVVARTTVPVPADITTPVVLLPANANRKGASFFNNSEGNLLIELGAAPTNTAYAAKINPQGYYELPFGFTGQIQGKWDLAGGSGALIREFS